MAKVDEALRRLTIGDPVLLGQLSERREKVAPAPHLDARTESLLRIAALIALDAPASSYRAEVATAQLHGARLEDLLATLYAVAATVGSARLVSAAPRIALASGYDVEAALE